MDAPWPLIEIAIEPTSKADTTRLVHALVTLATKDKSLAISTDHESGQIILAGASEQRLDQAIVGLSEAHGLAVACGAPQLAYRETLTKRIEKDYTHKKQIVGAGQFARVKIVFEPDAPAVGTRFVCMTVGGAVPTACIPGVEAGIASVARAGILAGFPVVGVRATLLDGAYHDANSSAAAFEIAARSAFREALREGESVLLEPVMRVTVTAPEDDAGAIVGDMNARGGRLIEHCARGDAYVVAGLVSLANMFGYAAQLRSLTHDHGSYEMRFDHIRPVPPRGGGWPPPAVAAALRA